MELAAIIFFAVLIALMVIFDFVIEYYHEKCEWQVERIRFRAGISGTKQWQFESDKTKLLYIVKGNTVIVESRYYINLDALEMIVVQMPMADVKDLRLLDDSDITRFKSVFHMYKYLKSIDFKDYIFMAGGYFMPIEGNEEEQK